MVEQTNYRTHNEISFNGKIIKEVEQDTYSSGYYNVWVKEKSGRLIEVKLDKGPLWYQQPNMRENMLQGLREKLKIGTKVNIKAVVYKYNDKYNSEDIFAFSLTTSSGFKLLDSQY